MTTHYLLLSGPLVPAALDGRKTQTRRIVAWHNSYVDGAISKFWREHWHQLDFSRAWLDGSPGDPYLHVPIRAGAGDTVHRVYPRYAPGDRLIFKETWRESWSSGGPAHGYKTCVEYRATWNGHRDPQCRVIDVPEMRYGGGLTKDGGIKWRSSMLMPAWAARSINRILDVRCQRLQQISPEDCISEGIEVRGFSNDAPFNAVADFIRLWDRINAKRGFSWDSNPYVWPITFEREREVPK